MYFGDVLTTMVYGFHLCAAIQFIYFLLLSQKSTRHKAIYVSFTFLLTVAFTIEIAWQYVFAKNTWLHISQNMPMSAVMQNFNSYVGSPIPLVSEVCALLSNAFADGLLLHRCFRIWSSNYRVVVFPFLLILASSALGLTSVIYGVLTKGSWGTAISEFYAERLLIFESAWIVTCVVFNVLTTFLIVLRLWYMQRSMLEDENKLPLGSKKLVRRASAILVQSGLLFGAASIWFLVSNRPIAKDEDQTIWIAHGFWVGFMFLSPQLVVLRVSMDSAIGSQPGSPSSLHFEGPSSDLEAFGEKSSDSELSPTSFGSETLPQNRNASPATQ